MQYPYGSFCISSLQGWQTDFHLNDVTLEDLVQLRIVVEWMLRDATVSLFPSCKAPLRCCKQTTYLSTNQQAYFARA